MDDLTPEEKQNIIDEDNGKPSEKDFSDYQTFIKNVETDLNSKFGNIGYACFVFDKTPNKNYSTLISNAGTIERVYDIIRPYTKVGDMEKRKNIRKIK